MVLQDQNYRYGVCRMHVELWKAQQNFSDTMAKKVTLVLLILILRGSFLEAAKRRCASMGMRLAKVSEVRLLQPMG